MHNTQKPTLLHSTVLGCVTCKCGLMQFFSNHLGYLYLFFDVAADVKNCTELDTNF